MYSSTLLQLIKALNDKEFKQLGLFMRSQLHNNSQMCLKLFSIIEKAYPHLDAPTLSKEAISRKMFPQNTNYDSSSLRNLMTQLKELVEEFLTYLEFKSQEEEHYRKFLLLRAYFNRDLSKQFEQSYRKERSLLEKIALKNSDYFHHRYLIEQLDYRFKIGQGNKTNMGSKLQEVIFHLDTFYLLNKLKYNATSKLNQLNITQQQINADELRHIIQSDKMHEYPSLHLYYYISLLFTENENHEAYFQQFKELLFKYSDSHSLSPDDVANMYSFATVYCTRQWKKGFMSYLDDILELYEKMLDKKLMHNNNYITLVHFKNLVIVGLRAKRYDWVDKFIEENINEVAPNHREAMHYFARALWHFYQHQYNEALEVFRHYDMLDTLYPLDRRTFLLRIYYETNATIVFYDFMQSFERFVRETNKLRNQQNRRSYLNFISLARQLFNAKVNPDTSKEQVTRIKQKIEQTSPISDKQWLLEKCKEFF